MQTETRAETLPLPETNVSQSFFLDDGDLVRHVSAGAYWAQSRLYGRDIPASLASGDLARTWAIALLQGAKVHSEIESREVVRSVDMFCGAGGFSSGLNMAVEAVGLHTECLACVDLDPVALDLFSANLNVRNKIKKNADALLDYSIRFDGKRARLAYEPEILEPILRDQVGKVQIVLGGPPCQGHSNLNNHTRRVDWRNSLYLTVPALGIALDADVIAIENVPSILSDKNRVVDKARAVLEDRGYFVDQIVLEANKLGVPQQRKRHFLLASRRKRVELADVCDAVECASLTVWDAIGDLEKTNPSNYFDLPADLSRENKARIEFLFDHNEYNLPNQVRPDCHKDGHTYPSVYGRLYVDRPAQTITGGFLSPGRGRYVHPTQRRGLTPHEGARLQGFPDSFQFAPSSGKMLLRKDYSKLVGDAVPPPLGYAMGLACLAAL